MIKVNKVMAEGFFHAKTAGKPPVKTEAHPDASDVVTISEEGKKKRIMCHVMAALSAPGQGKA